MLAVPLFPSPFPARLPALLLVVALLPFLVRTPRALVAMCLWLPVAAGWTAHVDYLDGWMTGSRARVVHGPLLRTELEALGATQSNVSTFGHLDSALLLASGLYLPGDEVARKTPSTRFLLREGERGPALPRREGYVERVRLCTLRRIFVIEERAGR